MVGCFFFGGFYWRLWDCLFSDPMFAWVRAREKKISVYKKRTSILRSLCSDASEVIVLYVKHQFKKYLKFSRIDLMGGKEQFLEKRKCPNNESFFFLFLRNFEQFFFFYCHEPVLRGHQIMIQIKLSFFFYIFFFQS